VSAFAYISDPMNRNCLEHAMWAKIGLAFWLLLAPGDHWTWVIVGGQQSHESCEDERTARLDGDYLVCAGTEGMQHAVDQLTLLSDSQRDR